MKFELVNPVIGGTFQTEYNEDTPDKAAKAFWEKLTVENKLLVNNLPKFMFTLKNGDKLYQFMVKETPDANRVVSYTIENVTDQNQLSSEQEKEFLEKSKEMLERVKQTNENKKGGKRRYKSSSSSSSSSSDSNSDDIDGYFHHIKKKSYSSPINFWWYTPSIYKVQSMFTPVFVPSVSPYVQLWVPIR